MFGKGIGTFGSGPLIAEIFRKGGRREERAWDDTYSVLVALGTLSDTLSAKVAGNEAVTIRVVTVQLVTRSGVLLHQIDIGVHLLEGEDLAIGQDLDGDYTTTFGGRERLGQERHVSVGRDAVSTVNVAALK